MDVWQITLAALRRWYILIPLVALTGWAVVVAGNGVRPEYEVNATAMVTPGSVEAMVPNPYGSLDDANQAVGIVLNSSETHAQIAARGLSSDFTVSPETRSTILQLMVRADAPELALATGAELLDLAAEELAGRQAEAGLPEASRYRLATLASPSVLNVVYEGKTRIQAVIGLLGVSIALVVSVLFDDIVGLVTRRRRQRRADSAEESIETSDDTAEPIRAPDEDRAPRTGAREPVLLDDE